MINSEATKSKIMSFVQRNGPSLPIQIAKELSMNSIFTSAFLSELLDDKKIKTSSIRVGGTSLYLIPGQEQQLEKFHNFLHQKEIEAYQLLKDNKILKDSEQEPAIRVALRAIKDFAFSFKNNDELYWRYLTVTEQEVTSMFSKAKPVEIIELKQEIKPTLIEKPVEQKQIKINDSEIQTSEHIIQKAKIKKAKPEQNTISSFINPLAIKTEPKQEKIKPKSDFVLKVINFLEENKFKILEEKEYKAKEYNCIAELETKLGPIAFLCQAKEKKSVSDSDLDLLLRQSQSIPLPALFIYTETLSKKAQEYQSKFYSILKTIRIE
ncbi:hypothetical protein J4218_00440 [Candidatus Pacearchaeota archaeon]|nr:hypothetical protein [Candidatus Pacearchaeota archaeon]